MGRWRAGTAGLALGVCTALGAGCDSGKVQLPEPEVEDNPWGLDADDIAEIETELQEAEFFIAQDLLEEAEEACRSILFRAPGHPVATARLAEIEALRGGPVEPAVEAGPSFDLAAELASEVGSEPAPPAEGVLEEYDPWEPFNEKMFTFNYNMDRYVLKPVAKAYNVVMPDRLQQMIDSGFDNLLVVPRVVNNLLQWRPKGAGAELGRFLINSTFGIGGLFDIAKPAPIRRLDARIKNGIGVMLDDLVAAFYTLLLIAIYWRIAHG